MIMCVDSSTGGTVNVSKCIPKRSDTALTPEPHQHFERFDDFHSKDLPSSLSLR